MAEDMLHTDKNEKINNTSENKDALLMQKQNILRAFGKENDANSMDLLNKVKDKIANNIDDNEADSIINKLWVEGSWLQSLQMSLDKFINHINFFIDKNIMNWSNIQLSEMKTYIESKITKELKIEDNNNVISQIINENKNNKLETERAIVNKLDIVKLDQILSQIEQKVAAQKDTITAQPTYLAEKKAFEAQQGKPISDEYFMSRFALSHIWQPDSVLTQADLLGESKEDLLARLNAKYAINETIVMQDKAFVNERFDGRVGVQEYTATQDKWHSFETVFTTAEMNFFAPKSQLRTQLETTIDQQCLQEWWLKIDNATLNDWTPEKTTTWLPKNILKSNDTFATRCKSQNLDTKKTDLFTKLYKEVYQPAQEKWLQSLPPQEQKMYQDFTSFLAKTELIQYKKTLQATASSVVAERMFADISWLVANKTIASWDWNLVPQANNEFFQMNPDGTMHMQYTLNGTPGTITIQANGEVIMWPVLWKKEWYDDIMAIQRKIWMLPWLQWYMQKITKQLQNNVTAFKADSPDAIQTAVRDVVRNDNTSVDVTAATMQTEIARQSLLDNVLMIVPWTYSKNLKRSLWDTQRWSDNLVAATATDDYSRMMTTLYGETTRWSASQMHNVQRSVRDVKQFLAEHPTFTETKKLQQQPEHIASLLLKYHPDQWHSIALLRQKQYTEEQQKVSIDNELAALEQKIHNNYS